MLQLMHVFGICNGPLAHQKTRKKKIFYFLQKDHHHHHHHRKYLSQSNNKCIQMLISNQDGKCVTF